MPIVTIDPALAGKVHLAVFQAEGLTAGGTSPELERDLAALCERVRAAFPEPAQAVELFGPARQLYRAIGLDPTKSRPSSEALIRRIILGKGLYRINRVVDTCNLCSIDFALSIGLYDSDAVQWPAELRQGRPGEGYQGLGKDHVNVAGRWTLADREGPFGNPSSDSFRTRITDATTRCTFVIFAPASYDLRRLQTELKEAATRMTAYAGGRTTLEKIL
jgi:DNA/RNA-binding domain of Phe-tRNA-synthetase-like protein